jgi:hypothetical protein
LSLVSICPFLEVVDSPARFDVKHGNNLRVALPVAIDFSLGRKSRDEQVARIINEQGLMRGGRQINTRSFLTKLDELTLSLKPIIHLIPRLRAALQINLVRAISYFLLTR